MSEQSTMEEGNAAILALIGDIRVDIARLPEKILEKADKRYAPIWVATMLKATIGIVGGALIVAILALILKV